MIQIRTVFSQGSVVGQKNIFLYLLLFISLFSFSYTQEKTKAYAGAYRIFPVDRPIEVVTKPGYLYTHIEGLDPQWKLSVLGTIEKKHESISGNGKVRLFKPTGNSGFHIVEEIQANGTLNLRLVGQVQKGFRYYIREDTVTVFEGSLESDELEDIPPITLPFGDYTFQAVATGYGTPYPLEFSLNSDQSPLTLDVSLEINHAVVRIATDPEEIGDGRTVILRRVNPDKREVSWKKEVMLNGDYISLDPGQYTVEFPQVENWDGPGKSSVLGRFNFGIKHSPYDVVGRYSSKLGNLLVKFDTGYKKERLDRVRFWLVDSMGERIMYPKEGFVVESSEGVQREVLVRDLKPGKYHVEFLVPNSDNLFAPLEPKEITIVSNTKTVHEQTLEPRYGNIHAFADILYYDNMLSLFKESPEDAYNMVPSLSLLDSKGDVVVNSDTGDLIAPELLPGEYQVVFGDLPGYLTPLTKTVKVVAGELLEPIAGTYASKGVTVTIHSNKPDQEWTLLHEGNKVISSRGSSGPFVVPSGEEYSLEAEWLDDYHVSLLPGESFALDDETDSLDAFIEYAPDLVSISLDVPIHLREGDAVTMTLTSHTEHPQVVQSMEEIEGRVYWKEEAIPAGPYTVSYTLPSYYQPFPSHEVYIKKDDGNVLMPDFKGARKLKIKANYVGGNYNLMRHGLIKDVRAAQGGDFDFENLLPGEYSLSFNSEQPNRAKAPDKMQLSIPFDSDVDVAADFRFYTQLKINSNVNDYSVTFVPLDNQGPMYTEKVANKKEAFTLLEGRYRLKFHPLDGAAQSRYANNHPDPIDLFLLAEDTQEVQAIFEANRGGLVVTSNLDYASYTVYDISGDESLLIGSFQGKHSVIPLTFVGRYRIVFDEMKNYQTPDTQEIQIRENRHEIVGGNYRLELPVAWVPAGPTIIGDVYGDGGSDEQPSRTVDMSAFSIGVFPVTNTQYAEWLTKMAREERVKYIARNDLKGQVVDLQGRLLFETFAADRDSQIRATQGEGGFKFAPLAGMEDYPVIEVSWYGAKAYVDDMGYRLPTEAEWEKSAAIEIPLDGSPIKKYRYGIGSNQIDKTRANYTEVYSKKSIGAVKTKPVGYYNGVNMLEFSDDTEFQLMEDASLIHKEFGTNRGESPFGLYDMSGNVREWVADWYDQDYYKFIEERDPQGPGYGTLKVSKGGSYDSVEYELRASARMPLPPENTDAFTGFRVVIEAPAEKKMIASP